MDDILLSIHMPYANHILDERSKLFEFRRRIPARAVGRVALYVASPTRMVVGSFEVGRTLSAPPAELWTQTMHGAGIERTAFDLYFDGARLGHALEVRAPLRWLRPLDPRMIDPQWRGPQSFCYLNKHDAVLATILSMLPRSRTP